MATAEIAHGEDSDDLLLIFKKQKLVLQTKQERCIMKNNNFVKEVKLTIEYELVITFIGLFFWVFFGKETIPVVTVFIILTSMNMYHSIPVIVREWKNRK